MQRVKGFTLVEVLVAIAIFALIGLASAQLLSRVLTAADALAGRAERLLALQRAMQVLDRDFAQVVDRGIRDEFGERVPVLFTDPDDFGVIEFSRAGWSNPMADPRGSVQRVRWVLEGTRLERHYWEHPDRAESAAPRRQVVLDRVDAFDFEFTPADGKPGTGWPPRREQVGSEPGDDVPSEGSTTSADAGALPSAIRVGLEVKPWGRIERHYLVAVGGRAVTEAESDRGDGVNPEESGPDEDGSEPAAERILTTELQ